MSDLDTEAQPSAIDAIAEDAAPREFPPGAPALWPYLRLPFRRRADFYRKYQALQGMQEQLAQLQKDIKRRGKKAQDDLLLSQAATLYDLYALMDDMMRIAAVDAESYDEWVETHSDEEFSTLFAIYVERSQPGEASGSAS